MTNASNTPLDNRTIEIGGKLYMTDAKGAYVPIELIRPLDRLMDETIDKIIGYAEPLSAEIARFRQHTFDDVDSFVALAAQEYGKQYGGTKGNITLTSFDGCRKIIIANANQTVFGPELQIAKQLIDECLLEWSADSRAEVRALVEQAFNVDKEGTINRAGLFLLLRLESDDERWQEAMRAIRDSIRVIGSKRYVRIYERSTPDGS